MFQNSIPTEGKKRLERANLDFHFVWRAQRYRQKALRNARNDAVFASWKNAREGSKTPFREFAHRKISDATSSGAGCHGQSYPHAFACTDSKLILDVTLISLLLSHLLLLIMQLFLLFCCSRSRPRSQTHYCKYFLSFLPFTTDFAHALTLALTLTFALALTLAPDLTAPNKVASGANLGPSGLS